jgi:hypothetical protein
MVLQSGMPRLGREPYFFGGRRSGVIVSIQLDAMLQYLLVVQWGMSPRNMKIWEIVRLTTNTWHSIGAVAGVAGGTN